MNKKILNLFVALLSIATFAQSKNSAENKTAIKGFDPVGYFESNKAIEGKPEIYTTFNNAIYYFSTEKNKELFLKNPDKYTPQFGGFCAYGVSENHTSPTDPQAFTIVDEKLYLNYNLRVRDLWTKDREARINKAKINWETLKK